jgi:penicillin-binding protein 1A
MSSIITISFWTIILKYCRRIIAVSAIVLFLMVTYLWIFEIPDTENLKNPDIKLASTIYDTKGKFIGRYQSEYRNIITYDEINPDLKKCLLAVEDTRFFEHNGVDLKALMRVAVKTIFLGNEHSGGGSTITQQLAKQLFPRPNMRNRFYITKKLLLLKSKFKEWIIAFKLENIYPKEDIMTMYLNKFEFINGAHGIDAAARTYFEKAQKDLSLSEAATLVGMLKNPSLYNQFDFLTLFSNEEMKY